MPRVDLRDKPIAITGASSGIGAATAIACARAGMPVVIGARRLDKLEDVAATIRAEGGRAEVVQCDVTNEPDNAALIDKAIESFGSIYAVFANAGVGLEKPLAESSDKDLRDIFEINFFSTMHTIRAALPHMIEAQRGHILICSSCLARFALPLNSAYSATKAAQHHIGRALNVELAPHNIRVSTIHPIGTRTELFEIAHKRAGPDAVKMPPHSPDRFMQDPSVVANAIVRCLHKPRPEVWTSFFVRYGMALAAFVPRISDRAVAGMVREYEAAKRTP